MLNAGVEINAKKNIRNNDKLKLVSDRTKNIRKIKLAFYHAWGNDNML